MTEAGIGRVLVASLHQGIADILPTRLDFYENWLNPDGLRHGTIGLAPLHAVLSFLRQEGDAYRLISRRAGTYAAEWTVASQRHVSRALIRRLPLRLRARAVLRLASRTIRQTYVGTRALVRLHRGDGTVDVRGSLFCGVRDSSPEPLCLFYAAVVSRFLELYGIQADVRIATCRATGDRSCILAVSANAQQDEPDLVTADAAGGGADPA
jgi:hypothetical protein